jgi:hypothetical protein
MPIELRTCYVELELVQGNYDGANSSVRRVPPTSSHLVFAFLMVMVLIVVTFTQ